MKGAGLTSRAFFYGTSTRPPPGGAPELIIDNLEEGSRRQQLWRHFLWPKPMPHGGELLRRNERISATGSTPRNAANYPNWPSSTRPRVWASPSPNLTATATVSTSSSIPADASGECR